MRGFVDTGLILVVLTLGGLVAGSGIRQTPMAFFGVRGSNAADPNQAPGPGYRPRPIYSVLLLTVWGVTTMAAAVLGWSTFPSEGPDLALAAMLAAVVSRLVVTVLFIAPIVFSEQQLTTATAMGARQLYRSWRLRLSFLDAIALLAAGVALVVTIS